LYFSAEVEPAMGNMQEMTLEPVTRLPFRRRIIAQWQQHWKLGCAQQCNVRFNFCLRKVCSPSILI